ncbi:MAG: hypothetical protein ACRDQZ_20245 [Mycobacteriales bacterium]
MSAGVMDVDLREFVASRFPLRCGVVIAASTCLLLAACGSTKSSSGYHRRVTPVAGGCGMTQLFRGGLPTWTAPAFSDSSPGPTPWPAAISQRGTVAAVVFGYPLRAGNPTGRMNKVLWIMKLPRLGSPLRIEARPVDASKPLIRATVPSDSSPGEIYPSYVNVPRAGCWRLTLQWAGHEDAIDLHYDA